MIATAPVRISAACCPGRQQGTALRAVHCCKAIPTPGHRHAEKHGTAGRHCPLRQDQQHPPDIQPGLPQDQQPGGRGGDKRQQRRHKRPLPQLRHRRPAPTGWRQPGPLPRYSAAAAPPARPADSRLPPRPPPAASTPRRRRSDPHRRAPSARTAPPAASAARQDTTAVPVLPVLPIRLFLPPAPRGRPAGAPLRAPSCLSHPFWLNFPASIPPGGRCVCRNCSAKRRLFCRKRPIERIPERAAPPPAIPRHFPPVDKPPRLQ